MIKKKKIYLLLGLLTVIGLTTPIVVNSFSTEYSFSNAKFEDNYLNFENINKKIIDSNNKLKARIDELEQSNQDNTKKISMTKNIILSLQNKNKENEKIKNEFINSYTELKKKNSNSNSDLTILQDMLKNFEKEVEKYKISKNNLEVLEKHFEKIKEKIIIFFNKSNNLIQDSYSIIQNYHNKKLINDWLFKKGEKNYLEYLKTSKEYEEKTKNLDLNLENNTELNNFIQTFYNSLLENILLIDSFNSEFLKYMFAEEKKTNDKINEIIKENEFDLSAIRIKENEVITLKREIEENLKKINVFKQTEINNNQQLNKEKSDNLEKIYHINLLYSTIVNSSIENFENIYNVLINMDNPDIKHLKEFKSLVEKTINELVKNEKMEVDKNGQKIKIYKDLDKVFEIHGAFIFESNKLTTNYFLKIIEENKNSINLLKKIEKEKDDLNKEMSILESEIRSKDSIIEKNSKILNNSEKKSTKNIFDLFDEYINNIKHGSEENAIKEIQGTDNLTQKNNKLINEQKRLKEKINDLTKQIIEKEENIIKHETRVSSRSNLVDSLNQTILTLQNKINYLNSFKGPNGQLVNYSDYDELSNNFKKQNNDLNNLILELKEEKEKNKTVIDKLLKEQNELLKKLNDYDEKNNKLQLELTKYDEKIKALSAEKITLESLYNVSERKLSMIYSNTNDIKIIVQKLNEENNYVLSFIEALNSKGEIIKDVLFNNTPLWIYDPLYSINKISAIKLKMYKHLKLIKLKLKSALDLLDSIQRQK